MNTKSMLLATCLLPLVACATQSAPTSATAKIFNTHEKTIGVATLTQTSKGVRIEIRATDLPPGELAFHIHEKGICNPADSFTSAGAHFNPTGKAHGAKAPGGEHAGDMANLPVSPNGMVNTSVINEHITLDANPMSGILDADGSALVIHTKPDDYKSQPSGAAGDRLACGVILPISNK
jgi:Cu-Zn family superoxide dismutase